MDGLDSDQKYIVVTLVNHTVILLLQLTHIFVLLLYCNIDFYFYFFIPLYVLAGGGSLLITSY